MQAQLIIVDGAADEPPIELNLPATIGRGVTAGIRLRQPLISREHCLLFEQRGMLFVRDLGSLNGTYIGSLKITEQVLPPGELLTVGMVTFRSVYELTLDDSLGLEETNPEPDKG